MIKAKNKDLIIPHHTNHSTKVNCKPYSKSVAVIMPPNQQVAKAPIIPANILNVTRTGIAVTSAVILGNIR
ncbi:hypothetical protein SDC9_185861 [bioreactor metagenome]|uniref:Uncharacterized protein n=1 Tax=bioreactor metagenome TaxID=1076179 RepID=A0A645HHA2_9ZZZZ